MQIDVLIIKKNNEKQIQKNIGQIFRKYNIVEYKSPDDYLSIDDFYKVYGYTCFYKSDTGKTNEIRTEDLTISLVCSHYPRDLIKHLKTERHMLVTQKSEGIYYIEDCIFPIQLIITSQLPEATNLWLKNLTNKLTQKSIAQKLVSTYSEHSNERLYKSVMNIIVCANETCFKEDKIMCEALDELYKDEIDKRVNRLADERVAEIVAAKVAEVTETKVTELAEVNAAELAEVKAAELTQNHLKDQIRKKIAKGKSISQIADELEETEETILPLYNQLIETV